jgi:hypothetical protein
MRDNDGVNRVLGVCLTPVKHVGGGERSAQRSRDFNPKFSGNSFREIDPLSVPLLSLLLHRGCRPTLSKSCPVRLPMTCSANC